MSDKEWNEAMDSMPPALDEVATPADAQLLKDLGVPESFGSRPEFYEATEVEANTPITVGGGIQMADRDMEAHKVGPQPDISDEEYLGLPKPLEQQEMVGPDNIPVTRETVLGFENNRPADKDLCRWCKKRLMKQDGISGWCLDCQKAGMHLCVTTTTAPPDNVMFDAPLLIKWKACYHYNRPGFLELLFPVPRTLKEVLTKDDDEHWKQVKVDDRWWVASEKGAYNNHQYWKLLQLIQSEYHRLKSEVEATGRAPDQYWQEASHRMRERLGQFLAPPTENPPALYQLFLSWTTMARRSFRHSSHGPWSEIAHDRRVLDLIVEKVLS